MRNQQILILGDDIIIELTGALKRKIHETVLFVNVCNAIPARINVRLSAANSCGKYLSKISKMQKVLSYTFRFTICQGRSKKTTSSFSASE